MLNNGLRQNKKAQNGSMTAHHLSLSAEETIALGHAFGQSLPNNSVVCFFGDLAAGKTTFIKGLVEGVTENPKEEVVSPTFVYLNIYQGKTTVYHFDLYRLHDADEFLSMGFDELFFAQGICCIEWSERISAFLPSNAIRVELQHQGENIRSITITREVAQL